MNFVIGWRQVAASFVLLASIAMITSSYSVLAVPLGREFQPGRMVLMLAITVVSIVSGVLAPYLGGWMDRFSLRRLMFIGSIFMGAGYAAISFAPSFTVVLVIFGLLIAPANVLLGPVAVTVLLSRWFVKRRGTALGIAIAGVSMGGVLFPPFIQWLLDSYEWRVALRIFAVFMLAITLAAAALIVDQPADKGRHPDGAAASDSEPAKPASNAAKVSAATILTDPVFWLAGAVFAIVIAATKGVVTNLAPLAIDEGIDASAAALLISMYSAAGFMSKLGFAAVADRFSPRVLIVIVYTGFALGLLALSQASLGYWIVAAGSVFVGFFGGLVLPIKSLLVPRIFGPNLVGRAMGLLSTFSLCISFATPPLFGLVFDLTGSYTSVCVAFAVLAGLAMLAVPYIRLHPRGATLPEGEPRRTS